jgi:uncharacterized membrane protein
MGTSLGTSSIFTLLIIAAVVALFVGLIGLIYNYVKKDSNTITQSREVVQVKENEVEVTVL